MKKFIDYLKGNPIVAMLAIVSIIVGFTTKNFFSKSVNNMRFSSAYSKKKTTVSDTSKASVVAEYKSLSDTIGMVGIVLAVILGLIGLMNFANTMVTSIIVRSRELAMLEAVGMTGVQQKRKLMKEGFAYFLWTVVVSVAISAIMSITVVRFLADALGMFVWRFTLMPLGVCLPLIMVLIIIIPVIAHNRLSKRSVIDRLRVE